jgi:hypothetical protein
MKKTCVIIPLLFLLCSHAQLIEKKFDGWKVGMNRPFSDTVCIPYFQYDRVEHYYIGIAKGVPLPKLSNEENKRLALLTRESDPFDTTIFFNLHVLGYVQTDLPGELFSRLNEIFCFRKHQTISIGRCMPVFRDILLFNKDNRIVGTARICFECGEHVITGTPIHTETFGQSGDYRKLYELLH